MNSCELKMYPPMTRVLKEGEVSDCFLFIMQGSLIGTYYLNEKDRQALFVGRKDADKNPDGIIKYIH